MPPAIPAAWAASLISPIWPGTTLTPAACASFFDSILSPIAAIASGGGPMKAMPACRQRPREALALGQEAVAGMHRLGAGRAAGVDDQLGIEIAFRRRRRAQPDALVRQEHMRRAGVGVGIDRDRRDPHPPRGADDAAGDLAPVRDQDLAEHAGYGSPSGCSWAVRSRVSRARQPL